MASSGSITTNECEGRSITLSWTQSSQSVTNNTTTIAWTLKGSGSSGGGNWVMSGAFKAVINGVTVYSSDTRIQLKKDQVIASGSTTISHNADGTKSFSLSCQAGVYTYAVSVTASGTHTLNTIPRASSISADNVTMGNETTISISRASSSFTHTLTYKIGEASGTIVTKTTEISISWIPAITLANQIPNAVSGTCTITCDTYNGSTKIGTKTCTLTLIVPESVKPTMTSVTVTRVDGEVPSSWAIYVQNKSKAKVTINGAIGTYGSTISSYSITGGGYSSTASSFTTGLLTISGTITFTAKVTDSRGRVSDAKTVSISVTAYSAPSFISYLSQRAISSGAISDEGTYIRGLISYSYSSCSSKNTVTRATYYKKSSETTWTNANKSFLSGTAFTFGGGTILAESSYDIKYTITDAFTTITIYDNVSTADVLMDFKAGGKGIAIGKVSETDNCLEISEKWDVKMYGKLMKQLIVDSIYPVGSIYLSVNSTNPSTLFGGTWLQLKDYFLVGAGNKYTLGSTGGSESKIPSGTIGGTALTLQQIPSHSHLQYVTANSGGSAIRKDYSADGNGAAYSQGINTGSAGGGQAHTHTFTGKEMSILPPYLAVNVWKRTN